MIFDKMFNVGPYTGNVSAVNVNIQFQAVGNEFHLILAPQLGFGLFQSLSFTDTITVLAGVAPNLPPANFQIVAVKDQVFFSAVARSAGSLTVQNTPGPTYNLSAGNELGGPTAITPTNSVTTVATLTGGNPGCPALSWITFRRTLRFPMKTICNVSCIRPRKNWSKQAALAPIW